MAACFRLFRARSRVSHNAKWWYSTVHLAVAIVGAGVLGLPSAMAALGWWPGMLMLGICGVVTACTMWQMIQLHEPEGHPRVDTFADLGRLAFPKWGWHFMLAVQLMVQVSVDIAYTVTGGYGMALLFPELPPKDHTRYITADKDSRWILVFGGAQAILSLFASYSTMTVVNAIATLMAIGYSTIIWGSALKLHEVTRHTHHVTHHVTRKDFKGKAEAMGVIAFAFGGQNILLEIQATMRSTPEKPSRIPMWNGVVVAYIIIGFCYFPVAAVGYSVFGDTCYSNVLTILFSESQAQHAVHGAVKAAVAMLVIHLTGSYQIYALPIYELLQSEIERRIQHSNRFSILIRPVYVAFTCFIAFWLPYFNELLGIIGGLVLAPSCYFMPIIWMVVRKPRPLSLSWIANMACIAFGVGLMFVATIGSFESLRMGFHHKSYQTFKFPQNCSKH